MALVLARVVGALVSDAVDRDQRAVEDRVRQPGGPAHGGGEVVGAGGEQVDGLAQVAPHGGHRHLEAGREAGEGVAVAQVGQGHQCLLLRRQPSPTATERPAPVADQLGQAGQATRGQRDAGRIGQQRSSRTGQCVLVDCCPTGSFVLSGAPTRHRVATQAPSSR